MSGVTQSALKNPNEAELDFDSLEEILKMIRSSYQVYYLQPKIITVDELRTYCNLAVNEHKVDAIFLDHMLLVDNDDQKKMIEEVSNFMKVFATENKIISFAISQMNRDTDLYNPKVSNMSGGRTIEHTATTLLTIGRHRENSEVRYGRVDDEENPNLRKIEILKARGAPSGTYFLANFRGNNASFEEIEPDNWDQIKHAGPNEYQFQYQGPFI